LGINNLELSIKKMNWTKIIGIVAGIAVIGLVVFKLKSNKEKTQSKVYQYKKEQAIHVETEIITLQNTGSDISFSGTFEPNRESKLSAEQQGKINAFYVDLGSIVSKGQRLVQLDNALLQQQLNNIDVQLQNAKTEFDVQLKANEIQIEGLKQDVNRYTILADADAIQGVQLEKAVMQLSSAENQRKSILNKSGIKTAEAQRKSLIEQIKKTSIVAPFDGVITAKLSEIGSFAAPGVPLLQLSEIGTLRFTINVPEKDLPHFNLGKSFTINADVLPDVRLSGKISMIGSKANLGSSFPVQFLVNNVSNYIVKAGMFGTVNISTDNGEVGIAIPASVVVGTSNKPQVYVVKNGKATAINITISKRTQNKVIVAEGLKEGDTVVISGLINVFEGANIKTK
jgi:RND family efflux transporter MFP subunit